MAKYLVEHACGCEVEMNLGGKMEKRERYMDWVKENKLCSDCYREKCEKEREEAQAKAAKDNAEAGLPPLTGSEKAVAWAETIRAQKIKELDSNLVAGDPTPSQEAEELRSALTALAARIKSIPSASWWIDNRDNYFALPWFIRRIIGYESDHAMKLAKINDAYREHVPYTPPTPEAAEAEAEAKIEATVRPETPRTETVAEIRIKDNTIEVHFPEKHEVFRQIVRFELAFSWSGECWERTIKTENGTVQDRAAELGHKLLANRFVIRIFDPEIRQKAINGEYEKECTRWIFEFRGAFKIHWRERNDSLYSAAWKIKGSKWSKDTKSVMVPAEQFESVADFAEMYKFKLSAGAKNLIEAAKEAKDKALLVNVKPKEVEEPETPVIGRKPIKLEVPQEVEVCADLRD